jgi:ribosomal protein S18 acetylase RimI-like enzyme
VRLTDPIEIRHHLEQDRRWAAYALGDLAPPFSARSEWYASPEVPGALALIYRPEGTPVLATFGEPDALEQVLAALPPEPALFLSIRTEHLEPIRTRWDVAQPVPMWRMIFDPATASLPPTIAAARLVPADVPAVERLFADGEATGEKPDFFFASMLDDGTYFGIRHGEELIAAAGTHLIVAAEGVAAIGNVYVRRDRRGSGYGRIVTAAVIQELLTRRIATIALNVRQTNEAAARVYQRLGFRRYCPFYEGLATGRE